MIYLKVHLGEIAYAKAGRDAGKLFVVVSAENGYFQLCDGKSRKTDNLKKKNPRHLVLTEVFDEDIRKKLLSGEAVTNRQVRQAISEHRGCLEEIINKE